MSLRPILTSVLALVLMGEARAEAVIGASSSASSTDVQNGEAYYSVYDYASRMTLTITGCASEAAVSGVPVYIRLKEGEPAGFSYAYFYNDADDICFFDSNGRLLSHELVTWKKYGESAFWVYVPTLRNGTTLTMCWNLRDGCARPGQTDAYGLWGDYDGVWHMDETIAASEAQGVRSTDATGHGLDLVPSIGAHGVYTTMTNVPGVFGSARVSDTAERAVKDGSFLLIPNVDDRLALLRDTFTLSFWVRVEACANAPLIFSRRADSESTGGFEVSLSPTERNKITVAGDHSLVTPPVYLRVLDKPITEATDFTHFAFVYHGKTVDVYANGVCQTNNFPISAATDNGLGIALGNNVAGDGQSLWGCFDEVRLMAKSNSAERIAAEYAIGKDGFYDYGTFTNDATAVLKNDWVATPSITKTTWVAGTHPTLSDFSVKARHNAGSETIVFYDRATGACLGEKVPTGVGDYRAVVTVPAADVWGALTAEITFRIVTDGDSSDLGINVDRILLMHDDYSTDESSWVEWQGYGVEAEAEGYPYWKHVDEYGNDASTTDTDYWSESLDFNLGGGSRHEYRKDGKIFWYLNAIRFGNTFNNGETLDDAGLPPEKDAEGLQADQNYLPWNRDAAPLVDAGIDKVGAYHRYAGQVVMQNALDAAVYSSCYEGGMGTIYFDAVNAFTDNIINAQGVANYRLVVQVATNCVNYPRTPPVDSLIFPKSSTGRTIPNPDEAVWHTLPMRVLRFDGTDCTDLGETEELELTVEAGGSYAHFYRVIVPASVYTEGRFRILRTAIDENQKYQPDGRAYILIDNVVCSTPTERIDLLPYGRFVSEKTGVQVLGQEGAFVPAFPSATDDEVYGRGMRTCANTAAVVNVTSATMHYRWHYLEQKTTDWLSADLNPTTFVSMNPLDVPHHEGDIDFWFDLNQNGPYYRYVDYSGTALGLGTSGYTEEITSVTNRASKTDWFVRMREGKSDYAEMILRVKTSERGAVTDVPMQLFDNHLWRGHYKMDSILEDGIFWRIEARDVQTSGAEEWNSATNFWYVKDWATAKSALPAAGRMTDGDTNSWCRAMCEMDAEYLTFQVDDTSRGVTIIRSDHQDFNDWNDAAQGYFTGSSTSEKKGTAPGVKTYDERYKNCTPTCATNMLWDALYEGELGEGSYSPGYETFKSNRANQWHLEYGQWVYGKYRDTASSVAYQMYGDGLGAMNFYDMSMIGKANWPRGVDMVSFDARIAQNVSPEWMAYDYDGTYANKRLIGKREMTNYTFMVRTCFDMNNNMNFSGNASLSLFAFYTPHVGAYEARWEQIAGETGEEGGPYESTILEPDPRGQRLVIARWDYYNRAYHETVLCAITNSVDIMYDMPTMPFKNSATTNNLMPMCISVINMGNGTNVVYAGVRIASQLRSSQGGVAYGRELAAMQDKWHFLHVYDTAEKKPTSGAYGVLSANCEGLFLTPQYSTTAVYPKGSAPADLVKKSNPVGRSLNQTLYSIKDFISCYNDMADGAWVDNPGRIEMFYNDYSSDRPYGFTYVPPTQLIDVYTAELGTTEWEDEPIASLLIEGFGSPKVEPDYPQHVYIRDKVAVRLTTAGAVNGNGSDDRTDVVISNVKVTQLLGEDGWSTSARDWDFGTDTRRNSNDFGYTNIVYTSGWITNGAVQLSAKRTKPGTACSIRSPLFDGIGTRASGLGSIAIKYRRPQENVRLKVQFVTNYTYNTGTSVKDMSRSVSESDAALGNRQWYTVTNLDYKALMDGYSLTKGYGEYKAAFGFHGAQGLMRIVMDNDVVKDVEDETNPNRFGEIEIIEAVCKSEPALDKGYWWGWNMQVIGDVLDTQKRMYLPDGSLEVSLAGQSLALNNSISDDINPAEDPDEFKKHMPFLQTPMFTNALIGQVSFKARKYELSDLAPNAKVVVYGVTDGMTEEEMEKDSGWVYITEFLVTNTLYTTYTFKTDAKNFRALRLGVVDVEGTEYRPSQPAKGSAAQRVLIDEVTISEAVRAMLAFRNVGAFRTNLKDNTYIPNVPSKEQQPLCDENWGIQAEVTPTMLGDEIDTSYKPRVKLYWFVGESPWGYENWKDDPAAGSAYLAETEGSNYVYRSSFTDARAAVMPAQMEPVTVQYMLQVEYRTLNTYTGVSTPASNWLDSASWSTPDWYAPLDYNADASHGQGKTFAGYTLIDTIAPGWAWINEANVFGTTTTTGGNSDEQFQYVEVCVPAEADLDGWRIRLLEAGVYNNTVTTNWVAKFGSSGWDQAPAKKVNNLGMASNKVFRCLGNKVSDKLDKGNGTLDGIWQFSQYTSTFRNRNNVDCIADYEIPFGIQLVRPSGIIEHSVVVIGTNRWGRLPGYREYDPTNIVAKLNQNVPGSKFFYAAEDSCGEGRSASVTASQGESADVWAGDWACSPGYINSNFTGKVQSLSPDHPTPSGDSIIVYAMVDLSGGPIRQFVGGAGSTATNVSEMIILPRGGEGTNILYQVDPWYELKSVTTNGEECWSYQPYIRTQSVPVGVGASNSVTIIAKAQVDTQLREKGLTDSNAYTPAVMDWLVKGVDAYGRPFAKYDTGKIALADFIALNDNVITNMTLTQMYWLDMDPTISNLALKAGMSKIWPETTNPLTEPVDGYKGQNVLTNVKMRVYMMITNRAESVAGTPECCWTPYILRGLDPNFTSWQFTNGTVVAQTWTSETFKVTGILANGLTRESNKSNWIPLRWFVFHEDSFYQPGNEEGHEPFSTDIEIIDPRSISSPGAAAGWYEWCQTHGYTPIFNSWSIDERLQPVGVEVLRPENFYEDAE